MEWRTYFKDSKKTAQVRQISHNAYRILGLPAQARWSEISQRASVLRRAAKAGIRQPSGWNLEWYGPVEQDERSIADALGRLSNPDQRLKEKLFWVSQTDLFLSGIPTRGIRVSIQSLSESKFAESEHDAAVLALISCVSADPKIQEPERWKTMLRLWVATSASDAFWAFFIANEQAGQFEPSSDDRDFDRVQDETLSLALEPVAELIRDAISQREFDRARRGLDLIRNASLTPALVQSVEEAVLGPYENSFAQICKDIARACWGGIKRSDASREANVQPCSGAVSRWKQEVKPRFHDFVAMAGADSPAGIRVAEEYAEFLTSLANAHTWANQWIHAEDLLNEACSYLPPGGAVRERVEATRLKVAGVAAQRRSEQRAQQAAANENAVKGFVELCESIGCRLSEAAEAKRPGCIELRRVEELHEEYKLQAAPWFAILTATYEANRDICKRAQNAAATCLFHLAVEFCYSGDFAQAKFLLAKALVLVFDDRELEKLISNSQADVALEEEKSRSKQADDGVSTSSTQGESHEEEKASPKPGNTGHRPLSARPGWRGWAKFGVAALVLAISALLLVGTGVLADSVDSADGVAISEQHFTLLALDFAALAREAGMTAVEPSIETKESGAEVESDGAPANGTEFLKTCGSGGFGHLIISNYLQQDALLKVKSVGGAVTIRSVFVRGNRFGQTSQDVTLLGIRPGKYALQVSTGRYWDRIHGSFMTGASFSQFENMVSFSEERTEKNWVKFSICRITLHALAAGKAHKKAISSAEFEE